MNGSPVELRKQGSGFRLPKELELQGNAPVRKKYSERRTRHLCKLPYDFLPEPGLGTCEVRFQKSCRRVAPTRLDAETRYWRPEQ